MLEDLPYEIFRRAENCFLPSPVLLCLHQPLLDWPPLSAKQPPPLSWRHSRCGTEWLPLRWASIQTTLHSHSQSSEQSKTLLASKHLPLCFIQNTVHARKPEQEHSSCRPRPRWLGLARADCDEKQAGTVTGSQVFIILWPFFFFLSLGLL